jgi:TIR domain
MDRQAFWSYVHQDDEDDGGRILQLADAVERRVRLLTGSAFRIFVDRSDLGWGDDWEAKLDKALLLTSFLIPIITPSYFRSEQCRRELIRFSSSAQALGLEELIMSIYYVETREVEDTQESTDEAVRLVQRYQWEDFRVAALEDPSSSTYRKGVDRLARELIRRGDEADAKPSTPPDPESSPRDDGPPTTGADASAGGVESGADAAEAGLVDKLAAGEEALPRLTETLGSIGEDFDHYTQQTTELTAEIAKSDALGKGFAGRLRVAKQMAVVTTETADSLEPKVSRFMSDLLLVDVATRTILQTVRETGEYETNPEVLEFVESSRSLAATSIENLTSLAEFADTLHNNASIAKDLRAPSGRLETLLRQLIDAQSVFHDWLPLADALLPPASELGAGD